ncbi:MAG: hypothetical protein GWO02_10305, partial [Gammaproteobacteria bacterium]|nr:hypothetical protein [Gammaproteobacteria bacterium]
MNEARHPQARSRPGASPRQSASVLPPQAGHERPRRQPPDEDERWSAQTQEGGHVLDQTSQTNVTPKASFTSIYDQEDPVAYFSTLRPLEYQAPAHAQGIFRRCVQALTRTRGSRPVTVADLCCGYGVNAALLNHELVLEDLYRRYSPTIRFRTLKARIAADRKFFAERRLPGTRARVLGLDVAHNALTYASRVGLLEEAFTANLESEELRPAPARQIAAADLVTVTGGLSYIGVETFSRLLAAFPAARKPWICLFPLRHSDMSELVRFLRTRGLAVEVWAEHGFAHRRFAGPEERSRLAGAAGHEDDPVR